eukprot:TRINITY_DN88685_c0_g1_i1.p1 TRINITY_DN88685_c0_g1~~TRINITY_DN88685_c0_g1_i1.p1  ORF type:complete len:625 (+),score=81.98 TRINITY_DN88685_c0_g1_i1:123-1997(+)
MIAFVSHRTFAAPASGEDTLGVVAAVHPKLVRLSPSSFGFGRSCSKPTGSRHVDSCMPSCLVGMVAALFAFRLKHQPRFCFSNTNIRKIRKHTNSKRQSAPNGTNDDPVYCSVRSMHNDWMLAVKEIQCMASDQLSERIDKTWDFGIVYMCGYDDASLTDITSMLDQNLGTSGALLGAIMEDCSGRCTWDTKLSDHATVCTMQLVAVQLPRTLMPRELQLEKAEKYDRDVWQNKSSPVAKPFFVSNSELQEISALVCQMQRRTRVQGSQDSALVRAWRQYLGLEHGEAHPRGILLFVDPLAPRYVVQTTLAALDQAFPNAVKCGGVCAELTPGRARLSVAGCVSQSRGKAGLELHGGVAGLLLPPELSLHAVVSPSSTRVGPELRVTSADGQIIKMMQSENDREAHPASEMLAAVSRAASPLQQILIEKHGFLLGLEAPGQLDPTKSKTYDDVWGSSERAPSYASLRKRTSAIDWLVRSLEPLPSGSVVIRHENLRAVPPRVGPAWLRCQVHVFDEQRAQQELQLMFQRYSGTRMALPIPPTRPIGAIIFTCAAWASFAQLDGKHEVGHHDIKGLFGEHIPVASVNVCGEVAPAGITIGGLDEKRTTMQGHTATFCFFSYEPHT